MKRNITLSSMSTILSTSMVEQGLDMDLAFLNRCLNLIVGRWNRQDSTFEYPEPLGYSPTDRSGWPQHLSCFSPN